MRFLILVQSEINHRVEFLESMTAMGKRKQYESQIKTEISQVSLIKLGFLCVCRNTNYYFI